MMEAARENRTLIGRGGLYGNVLRISPPLNIQNPTSTSSSGDSTRALGVCSELY